MLRNVLLHRPLVVLDLETTGTRVQEDRIVEICSLKIQPDGTHELKTRRVNPGIPIPPEASNVHGIKDADVENEPTFRQIARSLASFLDGCDLCGFNLWNFDLRMLECEFRRADVPFDANGRQIIDPCRIFHRRERRDLTAALRFYCGAEHEGAHGAEADVLATIRVLDGQLERYPDLPRTVAELHAELGYPDRVDPDGKLERNQNGEIVFTFGKHKGRTLATVAQDDPSFLSWMMNKDFSLPVKEHIAAFLPRASSARLASSLQATRF